MSRIRWSRRIVGIVAILAVYALVVPAATPASAQTAPPRRPPVYLMGDSTMLIMWYYPESQGVISEAYQHVPDFESCRTIIARPCRGRFGYAPLNVIDTMRRNEGGLGEVLVVMAGYDDSNIEPGIDVVMAEARRQGVTAVLWLTYTTQTTYVGPGGNGFSAQYAEHNRDLFAATAEYPDLQIADWNTYSAPHRDWFSADGIHMTRTGAFAIAAYLRAELDKLYAGPVGRCTSPDARRDPLPADAPVDGASAGITPVEPQRILDTRDGGTMLDSGYGIVVQVPSDVAAGASAAWVNVTTSDPCRAGYLAAGPCASDPGTSTVNHARGETRAGLALVPLDEQGRFCVRTMSRSDVVVDLFAVQADGGGSLEVASAERVADTRASGGPLAAGLPLVVDTGAPAGASGVFANLTVVGASSPTFAAAFPASDDGTCAAADWQGTSNVNVPDGGAHANAVLAGIGGQGRVCVITGAAAHVVVDRMGAVVDGQGAPEPSSRRLLDTRAAARPGAGSVVAVATGVGPDQSVLVTVTATDAATAGYLTVGPAEGDGCSAVGATAPTSTVNVTPASARANLALTRTGAAGQVCVSTYAPTHVVADLVAS